MSEERLRRTRGDETSADAARELGLDSGELQREKMKLADVRLFRIGQSWSRPLRSPDKLPAVDGPVSKSPTRDRVIWLAAHEVPAFFPRPEAGTQLSAGWGPSAVRGAPSVSHRRTRK